MAANPIEETKKEIVSALASNYPRIMTNRELASAVGRSVVQVNRALNAAKQSKIPMVETVDPSEGNGYRYAGSPADHSSSLVDHSSAPADHSSSPVEIDHYKYAEAISAVAGMFGKKKAIPESMALEVAGLSGDDLLSAAKWLEERGALSIQEMEDYEEKIFRKTGSLDEYIDYHLKIPSTSYAQKEDVPSESPSSLFGGSPDDGDGPDSPTVISRDSLKVDESEITARPQRPKKGRKTASDEANPVIDKEIVKSVANNGIMSLSGIGRDVSGNFEGYGKVGRPRVMDRVLHLVDQGKIERVVTESGERFKIPGTPTKKIAKAKRKRRPISTVDQQHVRRAGSIDPGVKKEIEMGSPREVDQASVLASLAHRIHESEDLRNDEQVSRLLAEVSEYISGIEVELSKWRNLGGEISRRIEDIG